MATTYFYKKCKREYCTRRLIDFLDAFKPRDVQNGWYDKWEGNKYFTSRKSNKEPLKMILPPPNVTGILHLGHALTATIQDALSRWYRMRGNQVVWVPGLDHAGIATQVVVEKYLRKIKGISRCDIGKDEFLSHVECWKDDKGRTIRKQLRSIGASLDWSKEFFTMDKTRSNAVTEAFVTLNERKLLYRDKYLVNWSPALGSVISDIEVEFEFLAGRTELRVPGYKSKISFGQIAEFSYKLKDSDEELTVASTRVETMLGDTAIAVHPDDSRYARYVGAQVWHPFREVFIPVIADSSVRMDFGTGAVKVTPAHDHTDYAIAKRHGLDVIDVIGEDGNINANANFPTSFQGLPRFLAREKILNELANRGCLKDVKSHEMMVPRCSRSGDVIEYLLKDQWFVRCKSMADRALRAVRDGSLTLDPAVHEQKWCEWLEDIRDWCVSRQLWWGHRIPAYQCTSDTKSSWIVARSEEDARLIAQERYGANIEIQQDSDVVDTWFSSALLPFSSMGWPNQSQDLNDYYPLTSMVTGHDILFFWVARMVMLGFELTGKLPFKEVLLHGILCDAQGKKMSKSLGNIVIPENIINGITLEELNKQAASSHEDGVLSNSELKRTLALNSKIFPGGIPECGADALRFTLCSHNVKSKSGYLVHMYRQISFDVAECHTNKLFCNKIWQASKYILLVTNQDPIDVPKMYSTVDRWILSRLSWMVETVNRGFEERNFNAAVAAIKQFFYYEFCDYYLEATKPGFKNGKSDVMQSHRYTLTRCLEVSLRILAPFMPYLSDELYSKLSSKLPSFLLVESVLETSYPQPEEFAKFRDADLERGMKDVRNLVSTLRSVLADVKKEEKPEVHIVLDAFENCHLYNENIHAVATLGRVQKVEVISECDYKAPLGGNICCAVGSSCRLFLIFESKHASERVKERVDKRRLKIEAKLKNLKERATILKERVNDDRSEHEWLEKLDQVKSLQEELNKMAKLL